MELIHDELKAAAKGLMIRRNTRAWMQYRVRDRADSTQRDRCSEYTHKTVTLDEWYRLKHLMRLQHLISFTRGDWELVLTVSIHSCGYSCS